MLFESKYALMRVHIRDEIMDYSGGFPRRLRPAVDAEFGFAGSEWRDGDGHVHVDITGHFFDSEEAAKRLQWTDEERQMCEEKLLYMIESGQAGADFWKFEATPAQLPWATYDKTHHNQIATIAKATGSADIALAYEKQNKNRPSVVKDLEAVLAETEAEGSDELLSVA